MAHDRGLHAERENAGPGDAARGVPPAPEHDTPTPELEHDGGDVRGDVEADVTGQVHAADAEEPGLTDEEIDAYRRRVADGFYNSREVAAEVARRMLRNGDV